MLIIIIIIIIANLCIRSFYAKDSNRCNRTVQSLMMINNECHTWLLANKWHSVTDDKVGSCWDEQNRAAQWQFSRQQAVVVVRSEIYAMCSLFFFFCYIIILSNISELAATSQGNGIGPFTSIRCIYVQFAADYIYIYNEPLSQFMHVS